MPLRPFRPQTIRKIKKVTSSQDDKGKVVVDRQIRGTRMAHRRFLGFARNDKKERVVVSAGLLPWDSAVVGRRERLPSTTPAPAAPAAFVAENKSQALGMTALLACLEYGWVCGHGCYEEGARLAGG